MKKFEIYILSINNKTMNYELRIIIIIIFFNKFSILIIVFII